MWDYRGSTVHKEASSALVLPVLPSSPHYPCSMPHVCMHVHTCSLYYAYTFMYVCTYVRTYVHCICACMFLTLCGMYVYVQYICTYVVTYSVHFSTCKYLLLCPYCIWYVLHIRTYMYVCIYILYASSNVPCSLAVSTTSTLKSGRLSMSTIIPRV